MTPMRTQRDLNAFGWSSSSDTEDEKQRKNEEKQRAQARKKKMKRKPPPQQSINKIWRRFAAKKFSKALSIMPFDSVPFPTVPERGNESLHAGYERAADECRRKVQKIIKECRRINSRYRDDGWDIDWDLKMQKGNCLNYLGYTKFDIKPPRLSSDHSSPKAVKRIHELFEDPKFMETLDSGDVKQGGVGNCWFIASLSSLANVDDGLKRLCVAYDTRIGIYGFVFFRDGEWVYSIIDDKIYLTSPTWDSPSMYRDLLNQIDRESQDAEEVYRRTYQTGSRAIFFGANKDQNETWVPLIEKAYAKAHGDFASLVGGWIGEGIEDLSGGVTTEILASDIFDVDGFWESELSKVNKEFLFGLSTGVIDGGYGERNGIREGHAYVVMDARTLKDGERLVKLRNPWGKLKKGIWDGPFSDGSKEWTNEIKEELGHSFGNDSVFWIRYKDLLRKYMHIDRTRLFHEPDWRLNQRWIGVEVPWKAQYNEKFHFTLQKESPVVLVLSQLDDRYYKGLTGQYKFRLHFRLHEQGRHDAEDYIVRSHGNYLMDRSVSIELPCLEPGKYSVFVKVIGERNTEVPTVEEIVKRECKTRIENEKLAQVGSAYDLAHSKGVAHLNEVASLRKESDREKASSSRKAERRRLWSKRCLNRQINHKQEQKNTEKSAQKAKLRRETREAEEAKTKAEKESQNSSGSGDTSQPTDKASQTDKGPAARGDNKASSIGEDKKGPDAGDDKSAQANNSTRDASAFGAETAKQRLVKDGEKKDDANPDNSGKQQSKLRDDPKPQPTPTPVQHVKQQTTYESDGNSSASPVSDWEELYSSDDMVKKPRTSPAPPPPANNNDKNVETDEEAGLPDPWNAICIVGFRIYSKDEDLDLRVVIEGGELAEGGMGEKGAQDIDNAQMNAAGERGRRKSSGVNCPMDEFEIVDGEAIKMPKVQIQDATSDEAEYADKTNDEGEYDKQVHDCIADSRSDTADSMDSSPIPTPNSQSGDCTPQNIVD